MSVDMRQLGIDLWSEEDRLRLIEEIWDSLPPHLPAEIPESHRAELDRRLDEADANPAAASSWQESIARLKERQ